MKFARTIEKVTNYPWLISAGGYAAIERVLDSRLGRTAQVADLNCLSEENFNEDNGKNGLLASNGSVAEVIVHGILGQRLSLLEQICGGCDYLDISGAVDEIAANPQIEGALFIFDSPGGMAMGCPECAELIAQLDIPKVGFTDSMMTSGAYYLASSLDYLVATPSADVGSIGVIVPWVDKSKLWDRAGLEFAPIYSEGDSLKSTLYGPSLSAEQRNYLQERVNDVAREFQGHVSRYRKLDFAQLKAGSYSGEKALSFNLVDSLGTIKDARNELERRISQKKAAKFATT